MQTLLPNWKNMQVKSSNEIIENSKQKKVDNLFQLHCLFLSPRIIYSVSSNGYKLSYMHQDTSWLTQIPHTR